MLSGFSNMVSRKNHHWFDDFPSSKPEFIVIFPIFSHDFAIGTFIFHGDFKASHVDTGEAVVTADFKASELAVKSEYPEYWQGDPVSLSGNPMDHG